MKLQAKLQLNLQSISNTIVVSYNTYEKASFDQYLAVSVVSNTSITSRAEKYIDDITGKGSLNAHFKKMIQRAQKFDDDTKRKILDSSLYPTVKIDKSNHYTYYPDFNVSIFNKRHFKGDLKKKSQEDMQKILLMDEDVIDIDYDKKEHFQKDMYLVEFDDFKIKINLFNEWYELKDSRFQDLISYDIEGIERYEGSVSTDADGEGWVILSNSALNNLINMSHFFYNREGNHIGILTDYLKLTKIIKVYGLYFYKEKICSFDKKNSELCNETLKYLIKTNSINEIKTKTLLKILEVVENISSQQVINYILDRKESKELALFGLSLLKKGLEIGWTNTTLKQFKAFCSMNDLNTLYRVAPEIGYSPIELTKIDDNLLNEQDKIIKEEYLNNRNKMIDEIDRKVGAITNSGIRERAKKVNSSEFTKKFNNKLKTMLAHKKDDIKNYSDDKLKNYYEEVVVFYEDYVQMEDIIKLYEERK
ncbi:MAG: hypothetical protein K2M08_02315 [Anaeroplasmataceae bacterium]|nr:hypothetical protein [Anaeroplasmataceae bacterium]